MQRYWMLRCRERHIPLGLLAGLGFALAGELAEAQTPRSPPVRLVVEPTRRALAEGQPAEIEVGLRGSSNEQALAPKDLIVQLELRAGSGSVMRSNVTIKAGTSSSKLSFPLRGAGLFEIQAQQRELRMGTTFLKVRPASGVGREPSSARSEPPVTTRLPSPPVTRRVEAPAPVEKRATEVARATEPRAVRPKAGASTASGPGSATPPASAPTLAAPAAPTGAGPGADVTVRCESSRPLANGKDPATIRAVWTGADDATTKDIRVFYSVQNGGKLEPDTLLLPKGQYEGKAVVTANRAGLVTIERVNTKPGVTVDGINPLKIQFAPPIVGQQLHITERITLVDNPQLTVRLVDEQGKPVSTDEPRQVKLLIESGAGKLKNEVLTIASNTYKASTEFRPYTPWFREVPRQYRGVAGRDCATESDLARAVAVRVRRRRAGGWTAGSLGAQEGIAEPSSHHRIDHGLRVLLGGVVSDRFRRTPACSCAQSVKRDRPIGDRRLAGYRSVYAGPEKAWAGQVIPPPTPSAKLRSAGRVRP